MKKRTHADDITDIETLWDLGNNNIIIYEYNAADIDRSLFLFHCSVTIINAIAFG